MRSFCSTPLLALLLVVLALAPSHGASSLRGQEQQRNPWEVQIDIRNLQTGTDFNNDSFDTEDGSDAGLLNRLIRLLLPMVNAAFQALVPDPLDFALAGRFQVGEVNLLVCKASADVSYDFGQVIGLGSLAIDSLEVVLGTESVSFGCLETLWNAAFDMTIASTSNFTVEDVGAGLTATGCGLNINREISGGVNTQQPKMRGAVNISGALMGTMATIDFAEIARSLNVGYESIDVFLDGIPSEFQRFLTNATSEISVLMKDELISTVEPTIKPIVEETLKQTRQLSYGEFLSINSGFGQNALRRRAVNFYDNTASFFGDTVSFLGFGGGGGDEEEGGAGYGS